ncbi:hypothetical protein Xmau_02762 [Xenorhabdus mauleonii]|uniref:Uncharacterized protein n=1 Tax=Xenorhabdus mauleonii TaxID=351675 RepID=A0A1I3IAH6_9GAMM|nr:hypothetical protein [Xenorhabdus mauleonii]PHM39420.1 hypothetical protein Xmau_02762 [Xenorhabdus mauleonii]SFI45004.1 hypothetical protein SAMN05421680_101260 [Xenorhabdus mauleonii]
MPIANIVNEVLIKTRIYFDLKTQNKYYEEPTRLELPENKRQFYSQEERAKKLEILTKTRSRIMDGQSPYQKNEILQSIQGENHVGNCGEYSCKAFEYLKFESDNIRLLYNRPFDITIIHIKSPINRFEHAFVMLSDNYLNQFLDKGNLSDLFSRPHNSDIWICDPWANIACLLRDYPFEWKVKMRKWNERGKLLTYFGKTLSPTDFNVYTLIDHGIKSVEFNENVNTRG